jgi:methylthioribose-1-phosphate isomerase
MQTKAEDVIVEMRDGSEVTGIGDKKTAPDGIDVINPAFDMTPPELITGIITEKGIAKYPFTESIKKLFD